MKKELYVNGVHAGSVGKPVFRDSSGNQLCIGDIVLTLGNAFHTINVVVEDCVYGWGISTENGNFDDVECYKILNYTKIENLNKKLLNLLSIDIKTKLLVKKEMTISEIEKELGYPIEIIKEK